MSIEVEATYENGVLKLDTPLPLQDKERVVVVVKPKTSRVKRLYGLIRWTGDPAALDYLIRSPENQPWDSHEN
jgi:predicted DNA-binding antitoxin AbrB/MazE fold protein